MNHVALGASRLEVSRLCLGTMNFGRHVSTADAHAILDHAHESGINYIDTANRYGTPDRPHASEEIIGDWIAQGGGRRERTVLATKVFEETDPWPNNGGLSALNIRRACDASLRRLKTDYIDIYQMHHIDRGAGWDEVWEAYDVLRAQGKVLYAGSSNFAGWHLAMAQTSARARGSLGLVSEQSVYSLAQRTIELEVLPAARALGIGVVAWSPLAGGLLAGPPDPAGRRHSDPGFAERAARHSAQLERTAAIADAAGMPVAVLALSWLLAQPGLAAAIVGPRTIGQLDSMLIAAEVQLDDAVLDELDETWPGPGGAAPEAYAW
ncbi:aryl-alcohol dehydrogenase-like predicted oxidoreductase [Microbacterium terrae]|uniref:General stress protein 69 n=1 Tax=Microbacterium terrae TaxID=69369 RepID=A0A0M2H827_9MICO|nr:aldo/keto reductase [Microbacterium terrae]KJL42675.1 General stress protein 69 [Microbacterium terrae]MBP1079106.1 aryl-alcohol dehydrogenase-like predicted oxidoreductase [Microbacterium terrae]GLJ98508.1 oxidoreductase [Microbacterium terrae]